MPLEAVQIGAAALARAGDAALAEELDARTEAVAPPDPATVALVRDIVQLQLQQTPLDALTAEVLPGVLDLFDAPAGALLLHHPDDGSLSLAAARGVSAPGARLLESLPWGDTGAWTMPLHALLDRKVYLIERPDTDPLVPELIAPESGRQVANLAAIPLYRWRLPVAVLLAIAGTTPITEDAILAHVLAYDVLALALAGALAAPRTGETSEILHPEDPPPPLVCERWIDPREAARHEVARLLAARDASAEQHLVDERSAVASILHELRTAVAALETERRAGAAERTALLERLASAERERCELTERVVSAERERCELNERVAALERQTPVHVATVAVETAPAWTLVSEEPPLAAAATAADEQPPPPAMAPASLSPARSEAPPLRVLDCDDARRARVEAALLAAIPEDRRGGLVVANVVTTSAALREQVLAAVRAGLPVCGYAAEGEDRSRILGPIRLFAAPPTPPEIVTALESAPRGPRRMILMSSEIDAFMPAKMALAKAGHSVSMAYDEKQALDLLAILRPEAVLVDLRGAPEAVAEFIDALTPETGRVLTLLVCGEGHTDVLPRAMGRMLRPAALDPAELARVCRNSLADPTAASRGTAAAPVATATRIASGIR